MARQENLYPECNVDTNLIGHIIGGQVKHKSCCNEVAKALNASDEFAIGVVDLDKREATFDDGFEKYEFPSPYAKQHISFWPHRDGRRFVFKVHKAMDEFIWDATQEMNVDLKEIGYPKTFKDFRMITKREDASNNPKLRQLFDLIKEYPELMAFRNTLKYLVNQKYNANVEVAKKFFDGSFTADDLAGYLTY